MPCIIILCGVPAVYFARASGGEHFHPVGRLRGAHRICHSERVRAGCRATGDRVGVASTVLGGGIPRGGHRKNTLPVQLTYCIVSRFIEYTVVGSDRKVHNIRPVAEIPIVVRVKHPVESLQCERRRSRTPKNTEGHQARLRGGPGGDAHPVQRIGAERRVIPVKGSIIRPHTVPGDSARHVGAVPAAVKRIRVRDGQGTLLSAGIVAIPGHIVPAHKLLRIVQPIRQGGRVLRPPVGLIGAGPAQIGVGVVDAGINDGHRNVTARIPVPAGVVLLRPGGERIRVHGGTRVLRPHVRNNANARHILPGRELTDLFNIAVEPDPAHRVHGGVQYF